MDKKNLVWEFIKIVREHRKAVEKRVCSLGIHPSQHHFLMYISQNGVCSQSSIAEAMGISAAAVAVSLKKLEKGGYLEKRTSPGDGRSNQIVLTPKGEDVVTRSKLLFDEVDRKMFDSLTEEQQKQLHDCMEIIIKNFTTIEERQED